MASDKQNNLLDSAFFSNQGDHFNVQQNGHMVLSLAEQIARLTAVFEATQTEEGRECIRRALERLDWCHTYVVQAQAPRPRFVMAAKKEESPDKAAPVSERYPAGTRVEYSFRQKDRILLFHGTVVDHENINAQNFLVIKKDNDGSLAKLMPVSVRLIPPQPFTPGQGAPVDSTDTEQPQSLVDASDEAEQDEGDSSNEFAGFPVSEASRATPLAPGAWVLFRVSMHGGSREVRQGTIISIQTTPQGRWVQVEDRYLKITRRVRPALVRALD